MVPLQTCIVHTTDSVQVASACIVTCTSLSFHFAYFSFFKRLSINKVHWAIIFYYRVMFRMKFLHNNLTKKLISPRQTQRTGVPATCICSPQGLKYRAHWQKASGICGSPVRPYGRGSWGCCSAPVALGPQEAFFQLHQCPL